MNQQKPQRLFLPRRLKHTGRIAAFFLFFFFEFRCQRPPRCTDSHLSIPRTWLVFNLCLPHVRRFVIKSTSVFFDELFCSFSRPVERFSLNKNRTLGRMLLKNISGRLCYDDSSQFNTRVPFLEKKKKSCRPFLSVWTSCFFSPSP